MPLSLPRAAARIRLRNLYAMGAVILAVLTAFRAQRLAGHIVRLEDRIRQLQLLCAEQLQCQEELQRHATVRVPPLVSPTTDLFRRNLGGSPLDDPPQTQRYIVAIAVGTHLVAQVDRLVSLLDLSLVHVVLFHYHGLEEMSAWEQLPWSAEALHVCAPRQTKWWFAKRFLTPAVVSRYEYIAVWDEDLGVDSFDFSRFVDIVRAHSLEISQPAVDGPVSWPITRRIPGLELHQHSTWKYNNEPCTPEDMLTPPCGAMVEVMAPFFTSRAWVCVWQMLQNDLVHAFGIDMAWHVCAARDNKSAAELMGIVDATPVEHLKVPSLAEQGTTQGEKPPWVSINQRRDLEWAVWNARWEAALKNAG